jgi:hypothetical protein
MMPQMASSRRRHKAPIALGLILIAAGALPVASFQVIDRLLHPQHFPSAIIGIVALGYAAIFLGLIVLAWGIVSWLPRRQGRN